MIGSFASGATASLVAKKSSKKPQIIKFYKTDSPKVGLLIENTISKFSKVPKNKKNIYKEASNQKVL